MKRDTVSPKNDTKREESLWYTRTTRHREQRRHWDNANSQPKRDRDQGEQELDDYREMKGLEYQGMLRREGIFGQPKAREKGMPVATTEQIKKREKKQNSTANHLSSHETETGGVYGTFGEGT